MVALLDFCSLVAFLALLLSRLLVFCAVPLLEDFPASAVDPFGVIVLILDVVVAFGHFCGAGGAGVCESARCCCLWTVDPFGVVVRFLDVLRMVVFEFVTFVDSSCDFGPLI